jgi:hypothetical protein
MIALTLIVALGLGLIIRQLVALREDIAANTPELKAALAIRRKAQADARRVWYWAALAFLVAAAVVAALLKER